MDFFNDIFHNLALLEYIDFILSIFFQHSNILTRASHHWCFASNIVLVHQDISHTRMTKSGSCTCTKTSRTLWWPSLGPVHTPRHLAHYDDQVWALFIHQDISHTRMTKSGSCTCTKTSRTLWWPSLGPGRAPRYLAHYHDQVWVLYIHQDISHTMMTKSGSCTCTKISRTLGWPSLGPVRAPRHLAH